MSSTPPSQLPLRRRVGLGVVSQAISSAVNLAASLVGARFLSSDAFGAFAAAYAAYVMMLGASRAVIGEPLLVHAKADQAPGQALASASAVAALGAAAAGAGAILATGELRHALAALAVVTLPLLVLDCARYVAFGLHDPGRAVLLDSIWAGVQAAGLAVLLLTDSLSPASLLFVWGAAAGVAAMTSSDVRRVRSAAFTWLRRSWHLSWRYLVEWSLATGFAQVTLLLLAPTAGLSAVGAVRGTQVVFGPLNVVFGGTLAVLIPVGAQLDSDRLRGMLVRASALLAASALVLTAGCLALPSSLGSAVLGDTWASVRSLIVPAGIVATAGGVMAGAIAGLRSIRAARRSLAVRLRVAPAMFFLPLVGAVLWDAGGYLWGAALAASFAAALWWSAFLVRPDGVPPQAPI